MFYTIGETAKMIGVAPSTLRYYDKEGLLPSVERSGGGIRMFQESDLNWLRTVECLKKTGMPIKEIKRFIDLCTEGDATIEKRLDIIIRQREMVQKQIAEMKEHLEMLEYKVWYYEKAQEAGTCQVHEQMKPEEIPEEFVKYRKILI